MLEDNSLMGFNSLIFGLTTNCKVELQIRIIYTFNWIFQSEKYPPKCYKCSSHCTRDQSDAFKLLYLPNQQSKTQLGHLLVWITKKKQQIRTFKQLEPANIRLFFLKIERKSVI